MITKSKSYTTTDGAIFATVELAQAHEIEDVILKCITTESGVSQDVVANLAMSLVDRRGDIINILTLKATSRPAARKPRKKRGQVNTPVENVAAVR